MVTVPGPVRSVLRPLVTGYANSVQPRLRAYRLVVACTGPFVSVTWSGGAAAPADGSSSPGAGG